MNYSEQIKDKIIFWFRRDLRLDDNAGLFKALEDNTEVIPVFIFDSNILSDLQRKDGRVEFILHSLGEIQSHLIQLNSSLLVLYGNPVELFSRSKPKVLYTNHDYEPYARTRDQAVRESIEMNGGNFRSFKDQVIFEKNEVAKDDGKPYTIFTSYMKKWKAMLRKEDVKPYPSEKLLERFWKTEPLPLPALEDLGFKKSGISFPPKEIRIDRIINYDQTRDIPYFDGTSRLGIHLRFGTLSIRKLTQIALENNEIFLNELIWRNFFMMILWHYPHVTDHAFKFEYDHIAWENDEEKFKLWCEGKTGFPIVDAGMRELNATGFMHNRVRMIVASFLCKDLHIDWRWGEAYFAEKLLDYELASNNGGWQWAAGTGCDAAPYFRVFNPTLQMEKFDPDMKYIMKWIPEWDTPHYPKPMVDHKISKQKTLKLYKEALQKV